ncbi:hypothetical protein Talka_02250 [Tepidimonas alkaliphilus]|uniref:Type II toxin-antitoxin system HicB family antitoxin n=1 Tax=Tepidimonas alkaliphilus TaxID=2588942 RepID=A0A554W409_9BURK|nr:type II toxin-antitoxin system HicB family antitoxin [Tepidimonas alkaliphilus]TSE18317.1 hypothetical protein Talka_02250 [Tepidimonas alkaliphilus]
MTAAALHYVVWPEDGAFVARCLEVDVASEGDSEEEALAALREALLLYFEDEPVPPPLPAQARWGQLRLDA